MDKKWDIKRWDELTLTVMHRINNTRSRYFGNYAPIQLFLGQAVAQIPKTSLLIPKHATYESFMLDMHKTHNSASRRAILTKERKKEISRKCINKNRKTKSFDTGDQAYYRMQNPKSDKLKPSLIQVEILNKLSQTVYEIQDPVSSRHKRVHVNELEPVPGDKPLREV